MHRWDPKALLIKQKLDRRAPHASNLRFVRPQISCVLHAVSKKTYTPDPEPFHSPPASSLDVHAAASLTLTWAKLDHFHIPPCTTPIIRAHKEKLEIPVSYSVRLFKHPIPNMIAPV